ncbi:hypothetical protein [Deinococcus sp. UR1]|nr:hypothetical protein [Deinococcus sp. UR1]
MTPKTPTLTITRTPDPKRRAAFIALITKSAPSNSPAKKPA